MLITTNNDLGRNQIEIYLEIKEIKQNQRLIINILNNILKQLTCQHEDKGE